MHETKNKNSIVVGDLISGCNGAFALTREKDNGICYFKRLHHVRGLRKRLPGRSHQCRRRTVCNRCGIVHRLRGLREHLSGGSDQRGLNPVFNAMEKPPFAEVFLLCRQEAENDHRAGNPREHAEKNLQAGMAEQFLQLHLRQMVLLEQLIDDLIQ